MAKQKATPAPEVVEVSTPVEVVPAPAEVSTPVETVVTPTPEVTPVVEPVKVVVETPKAVTLPSRPILPTQDSTLEKVRTLAAKIVLQNGGSQTLTGGVIRYTLHTDTVGSESLNELLALLKTA